MSSTSNVQNFLVNVFRPVYTYDPTTTTFTPKLELSNIDTYSGNTVSIFTVAVGDSNSNVYVGSNAGNSYTTTKLCSNVTAVGYGAGSNISNVSNATYLGFNAGVGALTASNVVAIGANANGNGISNVYVGTGTGSGGNSNVFLGAGTTGAGSGSILIGPGLSDGGSNTVFKLGRTFLTGDMSTNWLGIGRTTPYDSNDRLDVSGNVYVFGQQGINKVPSRTLDVNGTFRADNGSGSKLDLDTDITITGGFKLTLNSTAIAQPIIQYGSNSSGSGNSGSVSVTIPTGYTSSTSYITQITLNSSSAGANISVNNSTSNSFTIYWTNAGSGSHTFFWTTFGL